MSREGPLDPRFAAGESWRPAPKVELTKTRILLSLKALDAKEIVALRADCRVSGFAD